MGPTNEDFSRRRAKRYRNKQIYQETRPGMNDVRAFYQMQILRQTFAFIFDKCFFNSPLSVIVNRAVASMHVILRTHIDSKNVHQESVRYIYVLSALNLFLVVLQKYRISSTDHTVTGKQRCFECAMYQRLNKVNN